MKAQKKRKKNEKPQAKKGALEQGSSLPPTKVEDNKNADDGRPLFWVSNDIENGALFASLHHEQVKYVGTWKKWHDWTGSVWSEDVQAKAKCLAKKTAKLIRTEAWKSGSKDFIAHAKHSCSRNGVDAMLSMAESEERIRMNPDQFDRDPWLLNVANGTIDLRTSVLREHRRKDYITKLVDVEYVPEAPRNQWDDFLEQMVPDPAVRDYLQRSVGYTLTGLTDEQKFFLVFGRGASGKGTFIEAIDGIMGTYATVANFRLLLESRDNRFDMWRHAYSRMVSAQEVREGQKFDEATVKLMVGGDVQTAERKYCDQFQFTPLWTVWLGTNARPHIDARDDAMWRRLRIIPFTNSLPPEKRDAKVRVTLRSDRKVQKRILAWAVEGTRMWLKRRLDVDEPDAVKNAATEYMATSDNFAEFFTNTYEADPEGFVPSGTVHEKYSTYCIENVENAISPNEIARHLRDMHFESSRARDGGDPVRGWRGFVPRP